MGSDLVDLQKPESPVHHRVKNTADPLLRRIVLLSHESYCALISAYQEAGSPFGQTLYGLVIWLEYGGKARSN